MHCAEAPHAASYCVLQINATRITIYNMDPAHGQSVIKFKIEAVLPAGFVHNSFW